MYFTVNAAFINYLDWFPNLTESLEFPTIKNKTTFEQILPVSLNISKFDSTLLTASFTCIPMIKKFLICKKGMIVWNWVLTNISENYIIDVFLFITVIVSLLASNFDSIFICKHKKCRTLMASLVLHQVKEVGTVTQKEINT